MLKLWCVVFDPLRSAYRFNSSAIKADYGLTLQQLGDLVGGDARCNAELDTLRSRVSRIEQRLEIIG
jgi:hypothetical protein